MICLLLLPKTLNLSHFLSDWRNLLWRLVLGWHVAPNASMLSQRCVSLSLVGSYSTWYLLFLYLTMAGLAHTMPESDKEVQRQVEEVFGFKPCFWQICVVHAILAGEETSAKCEYQQVVHGNTIVIQDAEDF